MFSVTPMITECGNKFKDYPLGGLPNYLQSKKKQPEPVFTRILAVIKMFVPIW